MTVESPLVTILVPAYNAAQFIEETIRSLITQTYKNIEIIVSNNNSTDNTCDIVRKFERDGVRLIHYPIPQSHNTLLDISLSSDDHFNWLIKHERGNFVAFYHADDVYEHNIVEKEVDFLINHPDVTAVFTGCSLIDSAGKQVRSRRFCGRRFINLPRAFGPSAILDYPTLLKTLIVHRICVVTPSAMARRSSWIHIGEVKKQYGQASDLGMWLRMSQYGPIGIINEPLLRRRISPSQGIYRGREIYRFSFHPGYKVIEDHLISLKSQIYVDEKLFVRFKRNKDIDLIRLVINYIDSGKVNDAYQLIKDLSGFSIFMKDLGDLRLNAYWFIGQMLKLSFILRLERLASRLVKRILF